MSEEPKTPNMSEESEPLKMVEKSEEPPPKPKRGRPKKEPAPKPEAKNRGRPKRVIVDGTQQVAPFDPNVYNEQLLQTLSAHNNASNLRQQSRWSSLVRI